MLLTIFNYDHRENPPPRLDESLEGVDLLLGPHDPTVTTSPTAHNDANAEANDAEAEIPDADTEIPDTDARTNNDEDDLGQLAY
ncbi:hypothetical protein PENANT_c233G01088 [Penicillium antarcticum]|uniref:Uncharacterized protein n=1 Tax=Penicillium antarcticum TaxID=416450 RepID=A0A1V6P6Q4_9EURO|nr:hypothetical protein PENANT_c233G01088 [Penicillium antarcticum]